MKTSGQASKMAGFAFTFFTGVYAVKSLSPFKQSFLGTLLAATLVIALGIAGVALAQQYIPERDVNADGHIDTVDVQQVASSWNTSGSPHGTLTVFASTTTTTAAPTDARAGMGALCRLADPAAHFCTLQEINAAFMSTGVAFQAPFPATWVDFIRRSNISRPNGSDNYNTTNDYWRGAANTVDPFYVQNCNGWTSTGAGAYGTIIQAGAENYLQVVCSQSYPVACCK